MKLNVIAYCDSQSDLERIRAYKNTSISLKITWRILVRNDLADKIGLEEYLLYDKNNIEFNILRNKYQYSHIEMLNVYLNHIPDGEFIYFYRQESDAFCEITDLLNSMPMKYAGVVFSKYINESEAVSASAENIEAELIDTSQFILNYSIIGDNLFEDAPNFGGKMISAVFKKHSEKILLSDKILKV